MNERQPKAKGLPSYLVPALWIPLIGAVLIAFLSYQLGFNAQLQLTGKQKRLQAYSELMGRKVVMMELFVSRLSAATYKDYHERVWHLTKDSAEGIFHLEEARRELRRTEDLATEIGKSYQNLFETLGLVRSYFPYSPRLKELINQLSQFQWVDIHGPAFDLNAEQLEP